MIKPTKFVQVTNVQTNYNEESIVALDDIGNLWISRVFNDGSGVRWVQLLDKTEDS